MNIPVKFEAGALADAATATAFCRDLADDLEAIAGSYNGVTAAAVAAVAATAPTVTAVADATDTLLFLQPGAGLGGGDNEGIDATVTPGPLVLTGAQVGDVVVGVQDSGLGKNGTPFFESTITVANQIQQTGGNLVGTTLLVLLRRGNSKDLANSLKTKYNEMVTAVAELRTLAGTVRTLVNELRSDSPSAVTLKTVNL